VPFGGKKNRRQKRKVDSVLQKDDGHRRKRLFDEREALRFEQTVLPVRPQAVALEKKADSFELERLSFEPKAVLLELQALSLESEALSLESKDLSLESKDLSLEPTVGPVVPPSHSPRPVAPPLCLERLRRMASDRRATSMGLSSQSRRRASLAFSGPSRPANRSSGHFPNDDAVRKILFLALQHARLHWKQPIHWKKALAHFAILF